MYSYKLYYIYNMLQITSPLIIIIYAILLCIQYVCYWDLLWCRNQSITRVWRWFVYRRGDEDIITVSKRWLGMTGCGDDCDNRWYKRGYFECDERLVFAYYWLILMKCIIKYVMNFLFLSLAFYWTLMSVKTLSTSFMVD